MGVKIYPRRVIEKTNAMDLELNQSLEAIRETKVALSRVMEAQDDLAGRAWDSARAYIEAVQYPHLDTATEWARAMKQANAKYRTAAQHLPDMDCLDEEELQELLSDWEAMLERELRDDEPDRLYVKFYRSMIKNIRGKLQDIRTFLSVTNGIYDPPTYIQALLERVEQQVRQVSYQPGTMQMRFTSLRPFCTLGLAVIGTMSKGSLTETKEQQRQRFLAQLTELQQSFLPLEPGARLLLSPWKQIMQSWEKNYTPEQIRTFLVVVFEQLKANAIAREQEAEALSEAEWLALLSELNDWRLSTQAADPDQMEAICERLKQYSEEQGLSYVSVLRSAEAKALFHDQPELFDAALATLGRWQIEQDLAAKRAAVSGMSPSAFYATRMELDGKTYTSIMPYHGEIPGYTYMTIRRGPDVNSVGGYLYTIDYIPDAEVGKYEVTNSLIVANEVFSTAYNLGYFNFYLPYLQETYGYGRQVVDEGTGQTKPNLQSIMDGLKDAEVTYKVNPATGKMEPYMKQYQVNDDYKVVFRRDFDGFNTHDPAGNHWNLEVQTTGGRTVYDLHVYTDEAGNLLPFTNDNIYIPRKSPFNN